MSIRLEDIPEIPKSSLFLRVEVAWRPSEYGSKYIITDMYYLTHDSTKFSDEEIIFYEERQNDKYIRAKNVGLDQILRITPLKS